MLKGIHAALNRYASFLSLAQKNKIQCLIQREKNVPFNSLTSKRLECSDFEHRIYI